MSNSSPGPKARSIAPRASNRTPGASTRSTGSIAPSTGTPYATCSISTSTSTRWLPPDDASYGFDNIAGVLKISPTLIERYLSVAQKVSRTALGIAPPSPTVDYVRVADDRAQEQELPGQLFGTRGGASIRYTFPMDASYTVRVQLSRDLNEQVPIYVEPQDLEISIDGERVTVFTLPGAAAPAGPPATEPAAASDAGAAQPAGRGQGRGAGARAGGAGRGGGRQGQEAAQSRRPRLGSPRAREGRAAPRGRGVRRGRVDAITETARLPFLRPYPAGVNIAETRSGALSSQRRDQRARSIRRVPATRRAGSAS